MRDQLLKDVRSGKMPPGTKAHEKTWKTIHALNKELARRVAASTTLIKITKTRGEEKDQPRKPEAEPEPPGPRPPILPPEVYKKRMKELGQGLKRLEEALARLKKARRRRDKATIREASKELRRERKELRRALKELAREEEEAPPPITVMPTSGLVFEGEDVPESREVLLSTLKEMGSELAGGVETGAAMLEIAVTRAAMGVYGLVGGTAKVAHWALSWTAEGAADILEPLTADPDLGGIALALRIVRPISAIVSEVAHIPYEASYRSHARAESRLRRSAPGLYRHIVIGQEQQQEPEWHLKLPQGPE